ncbi:NUMOD4 domain-containing protein [Mycobacteroides abscessus]|nr:HNH endonuclease [Mycobacteroides abscessus subsp. abscessus]QPO17428.1 HNH endonuclease [Mycobacterium phage phiGD24-3]QSM02204.1 HNH endonuclease [Mycobacterium phage prophiGD24-3]SHY71823.1 NUMOD4 motif [Mycobacteroides abscessus subsp. abscessus]SHZ92644.1 NUMOD4 motif [Mycobacteroides abscessus subsp. abscessus]
MADEEWRPVIGWDGYEVSNYGNVRSYRKPGRGNLYVEPRPRKLVEDSDGYLRLVLSNGPRRKFRGVHQLVAEAFLAESQFEGAIVLHKDDNPKHNHVSNLEWGTHADNMRDHMTNKGLGVRLSADDVVEIKRLYEMGFTQREIARVFRTTQSYVHNLISSKQRKDVA